MCFGKGEKHCGYVVNYGYQGKDLIMRYKCIHITRILSADLECRLQS